MLGRLKFDLNVLVDEILNQLPESIWTSTTTTFLDPAIGGGQFVISIERRLRNAGHSDENIANRVFGYEDNQMRINFAVNKHKLKGTYTVRKFIEDNDDMKFDVIVGNPPFQSTDDSGNRKSMSTNLWSKFIKKSFDMINDGGVVAMITPASWASNTIDINEGKVRIFKDIFNVNNPLAINLSTVKQYFPTVGSTFSYFVVEKAPNAGQTKVITQDGDFVTNLTGFVSLPKVITKESLSINNKFAKQMTNNSTCAGQMQSSACKYSPTMDQDFTFPAYHTAAVEDSGTTWYTNVEHPNFHKNKIIFSLSGYFRPYADPGKLGYTDMCLAYILADTEKLEYAMQVFSSKLFAFVLENNKWSGFNPKEIIRSFPKLDLTRSWTDSQIYAHFNLTKEEIDYVESNVK